MHHLLSPIVDRRLRLLERLTYRESAQPLSALAAEWDLPQRTLVNDIQAINKSGAPVEIRLNGEWASVHYPAGSNIGDLYRMILIREPIFHLLRALILHPGLPNPALCQQAAMSEASLYRYVQLFNHSIFPKIGVSIASNPFHLSGQHTDLLLFSSIFLFKQSRMSEWPFPDYPKEMVEDFVSLMLDRMHIAMDFAEFRMLCFYVVLSMIWAKAKHTPEELARPFAEPPFLKNKQKKEALSSLPNLPQFLLEAKAFEAPFAFPMTLNTLIYLYSLYFKDGFFASYRALLNQAAVDPKVNRSFFYLTKVLNYLERRYGIKPDDRHEIIRELHNTLYAQYMEPDMAPFFYGAEDPFHQWIAQSFPTLHRDLQEKIRGYFHYVGRPVLEVYVDSCLFYIFMKWGRLLYRGLAKRAPVSLLILSSMGHAHAQSLREVVQSESLLPVQIDVFDERRLDCPKLLQAGYDLIWSNFSLEAPETEATASPPAPEDLERRDASESFEDLDAPDAPDAPHAPDAPNAPHAQTGASQVLLFHLYPSRQDLRDLQRAIADKLRNRKKASI